MKTSWVLLLMLLAIGTAIAQPPAMLWENFYGDDRTDRAYDVAVQSDGSILVAGETRVYRDVQDNDDAIVLWLNANGDSLNAIRSGTEQIDEFGRTIFVNDDDTFVIAGRARQPSMGWAYMEKYSADGTSQLWHVDEHFNMMPQNFFLGDIAKTPDGGYVICGARTNGMGMGPEIMFLWKVDDNGSTVWLQEFANHKYAHSIALRNNGGFLVAGANFDDAWIAAFDENGNLLHSRAYTAFGSANFASGIVALDDGGGVFCGTVLNQDYEHRARVLRFDFRGDIVWDARFGTEGFAYDIIQAQDGNYVVAGSEVYNDTTEFAMIAEVSSEGHLMWYNAAGEPNDVYTNYSLCQLADGSYITAGFGYPNGPNGTPDIMVQHFDAETNLPPVELTLTPYNTEFPAEGGVLVYDLHAVSNTNLTFNNIRFWSSVMMPSGVEVSPLDQAFVNLMPFMEINRTGLTQNIPAAAPTGEYTFIMRLGRPDDLYVEDSFTFTKLGDPEGVDMVGEWDGSNLSTMLSDSEYGTSVDVLPSEFGLAQAYPNPFNAQTTISVTLPESSDLTVAVFNALGQQVATLAQGQFNAGSHQFSFDASDLSSGLYFYTMQAGQFSATRKMVLMK